MRTHSIIVLGLATAGANAASGTGVSTRYWDCCKPSCAWPGKAAVSKPFTACNANDNPISDANTKSGCESGGTAYTCVNNSPWALNDRVSYGFAATAISGESEASWCCACYQLTFTSGKAIGKTMVVQSSNTGGDLGNNHFDILMPGGGLGIFDGCTSQFGGLPGAQYGGISQRSECALMPAALRAGCYWRFDWFMNADNPNHKFTQVKCPAELVARSGCVRNDDSQFPEFVMPTDTTWNPPTPTETAATYGQCDSLTWDVAKKCPSGYYCSRVTDYYWQCIPGTASTTSTSTSAATSTTTTTLQTSTSKTSTSTASTTSSGSGTAALWAQCAGGGFPTLTCVSGSKCVYVNDWYSQCQPS